MISHKDSARLSDQLATCKQWLIDNKLSLHVGKTECILFGTKRKLKRVQGFRVTCEGSLVKQVKSVTYLGVILDDSLSGTAHAQSQIKKCSGRLAFLFRNGKFLDFNLRKTLCTALVQPYLDYCCSSWYPSLTTQLKNKLDVIQRRMVRFIYGVHHMYHIGTSDLKQMHWLKVSDRVKFFDLVSVFKIRLGQAPGYLTQNFVPVAELHTYNTRSSAHDFALKSNVARSHNTFSFIATQEWRALPPNLKGLYSISTFKKKVREWLLSAY